MVSNEERHEFLKKVQEAAKGATGKINNPSGVVVFDTETTGLDFDDSEIIQFSAMDGDGNVLLDTLVRPYWSKEWPEAENINHISPEMTATAPYPHEIAAKVKEIFNSADTLVAYNAPFDLTMLKSWGIEEQEGQRRFDVMVNFAFIYGEWNDMRQDYKWQKLVKCADYYGYDKVFCDGTKAHDSLEDVRATLYCYNKILEPLEVTVDELVRDQKENSELYSMNCGKYQRNYNLKVTGKAPKDCSDLLSGFMGEKLDLSELDTSETTDMSCFLADCPSLKEVNLTGLDTSNVTNMQGFFDNCKSLEELDLSSLDTSKVTDMHSFFEKCYSLTEVDLTGLDTSNVTDMDSFFAGCGSLEKVDLSSLNTSNVANMGWFFEDCNSLEEVNLAGLDTSNVWNMSCFFDNCHSLKEVDLAGLDTSKVENMCYFFENCESLERVDLSDLDTSNVTKMYSFFENCRSLEEVDLTNLNTSNVKDMNYFFSNCKSLKKLDLSSFNLENCEDTDYMFENVQAEIIASDPKIIDEVKFEQDRPKEPEQDIFLENDIDDIDY
ncbi:MAG: BspA family leucine-rich repeat surface protein [Eubacterium sp.]|nr:BspA family leucine-rich repeat surface protein [Eubacterium sp.]